MLRKGRCKLAIQKQHRVGYRSSFAWQIMTTEDRLISPTTDMLFLYIIILFSFSIANVLRISEITKYFLLKRHIL